ncbi:SPOR domain-containing protein [Persicobacter psychrovividus]|uniref:SPOR domain-containing protein n=1 Tax=Persicobacter psychrovividus TaxID=387638 RepID=A0ABN6L6Z2_9BACT|nr:hypothetical protein PEPS_12460 [Persicobacter psychrovividus]
MASINDLNNDDQNKEELDGDNFGLPNFDFDSNTSSAQNASTEEPSENTFFNETNAFEEVSAAGAFEQEETNNQEEAKDSFSSDFNVEEEEEDSNRNTWIWIGVVILLLVGVGTFIFKAMGPDDTNSAEANQVVQEALQDTQVAETASEPVEEVAPEPVEVVETPVAEESGIVRLTSLTGNFHVVVKSFVDSDLAMDFAKQLEAEGNTVYLFNSPRKPNGMIYHRVALGKFTSEEEATASKADYSGTYGEDVWVKKF